MSGRSATRRLRIRRAIRLLGCDRNPMRRPVDRFQTAVAFGLLFLFLLLAPPLAMLTTGRVYHAGLRAERVDRASHRAVVATVEAGSGVDDDSRDTRPTVRLRWRAKDGAFRSAEVPQRASDRIGSRQRIWIDGAGNLTRDPRDHGQTVTDTILVGAASLTAIALPCFMLYIAVRHRLDRHRFDQWTADWARTAPLWTRRSR